MTKITEDAIEQTALTWLQNLKEGDLIPMGPIENFGFNVHTIVSNHYMLWGEHGEMSWLWYLNQIEENNQVSLLVFG